MAKRKVNGKKRKVINNASSQATSSPINSNRSRVIASNTNRNRKICKLSNLDEQTKFYKQFHGNFFMLDLQLKPYRTDEFVHKLFYETSRFSAFSHQWVVKAIINNSQTNPHQCSERELTYQVSGESEKRLIAGRRSFVKGLSHFELIFGPSRPQSALNF